MLAPSQPRSRPPTRRPTRWTHVYVLLVTIDLATACLGLLLNQRLTDLYHLSVARDTEWSLRANHVADAVADTTRLEAYGMARALDRTPAETQPGQLAGIVDDDLGRLAAEFDGFGAASVASHLRSARTDMQALATDRGAPPQERADLARLLGDMSDLHARAMSTLLEAAREIRERRLGAFAADAERASVLHGDFLAIVSLVVLLVIAVTLHGLRLVRRFKANELEVEGHLAALESSEARSTAVLESALDAIIIMDGEGLISEFNPAAQRIFGMTRDAAVGRKLSDAIIPPDLREAHQRGLANYLATGEGPVLGKRIEIRAAHANGNEFPVELAIIAVGRGPGAFFIGHLRDITERKRSEENLRASNQELEQFAYIASHDLQEPLRTVTSYLGLLKKRYGGSLDAKADDFMQVAMDGADRMHHLIQDLLALSRVERSDQPVEPISSEDALAAALVLIQPAIAESLARISHAPLPMVRIDRTHLTQLLQNLIGNALKFRGTAAPEIVISASRSGAWWNFAVKDNGIGIDPGQSARIFEVFQRLHSREEYPGTGIGLAICKKIVERNGGRIWVESTPGDGATFLFTLPA